MRAVFGLVLLIGVALAGGAVYMAKDYISAYQNELARKNAELQAIVPTIDVYVANRALKYGELLTMEDVRKVSWPENAIPEGAFMEEDILFPDENEEPRSIVRAMEKDEAVLAVKITKPGEDAGLTSRLEKGKRAFAIKVDVASGVSGFLRPGDRVDVYWTGRVDNDIAQGRGEVTKLIEAGVSLIAIDQSTGGDVETGAIAQTVTVAVKPDQVASLAQAQSTGRLSLSLVGAEDDTVASAIEVDQRKLLGIAVEAPTPKEVEAQEEKCFTVERRGGERIESPIPCTN